MKKLLVVGTGDFSDVVSYVIEKKLGEEVAVYAVHEKYRTASSYHGRPLAALETVQREYPPEEYDAVLGLIGKQMFRQREAVFCQLLEKKYQIRTIIDPSAHVDTAQIGQGNLILAGTAVEAHCRIGNGNIIWQNVVLPHHNEVGDFNNLAPSSSFSGYSRVGSHCFIGNNVCVKNRIAISDYAYIGAGAYVSRSVASRTVIVPNRSYVLEGKTGFDFL